MNKYIIFICLILSSCNLINQDSKDIITSGNSTNQNTEHIIKNIAWTGELSFPECVTDFSVISDPIIQKLVKKIEEYGDLSSRRENKNWSPFFGRFLQEYCTTGDGKYIFYSSDKAPPSFGRYDAQLDIIEEAQFTRKYIDYVGWFDKFGAFGKRHGDIIDVKTQINHNSYNNISPIKKLKNQKYCDNGLTPGGKRLECYYRVSYEYNFIKNTFTEKNICTFYKDDLGQEQALESCFDVIY